MLESGTLILDHTLFTWAPTVNTHIYVAWIAEITLYFLNNLGGPDLLFAFRYLCYAIFAGIVIANAHRLNVSKNSAIWLILLMGISMSQSAKNILSLKYFPSSAFHLSCRYGFTSKIKMMTSGDIVICFQLSWHSG
jgi:hypothetical protein